MTSEHEKYLAEGITRIATHCNQWNDFGTWDDHMKKVIKDLVHGNTKEYHKMLKEAYEKDKTKIKDCYVENAYIVCILSLMKLFKEDFAKGKNHKNNKDSMLMGGSANGKRKGLQGNISNTEAEEYVL